MRRRSQSSPIKQYFELRSLTSTIHDVPSAEGKIPSSSLDLQEQHCEHDNLHGDGHDGNQESCPPNDSSDSERFPDLTLWQLLGLYTSHFLSMWNSRTYEYASVLFTASAYPDTLTVASIRGLSANLAALLLSPPLGAWCNAHPSRLRTLQLCIAVQRVCICVACLLWPLILQDMSSSGATDSSPSGPDDSWPKHAVLILVLLLGMLEKVSSVGNLIVMERDWLPQLAEPTSNPPLHVLNASIKRIDLICKLLAPLAVSTVALSMTSLRDTSFLIAVAQLLSVFPELHTAWRVWLSSPNLQRTREGLFKFEELHGIHRETFLVRGHSMILKMLGTLHAYFRAPTWAPSLASALQPFSVLTLSASMTVYLLTARLTLFEITAARTVSTVVEISSTILTPILISRLGSGQTNGKPLRGQTFFGPLILVGRLGQCWQLAALVPAVAVLVLQSPGLPDDHRMPPWTGTILLGSLALSRLGPFAFSLVEQQLVQTMVPVTQRVEFSGVEMAFVSFAEMLRWALTGIFGEPSQFKYIASASYFALLVATAVFWMWSRRRSYADSLQEYELIPTDVDEQP